MKFFNNIAMSSVAALCAGLLAVGCDDDTKYDDPSGETFIYEIAVGNGGFTGADIITGTIDEDAKTIEFTIPAETDIEAIRFNTKLSLGAKLDRDTYDATSGAADVTVVNNLNSTVYHAVFTMLAAKETPIVRSIQCYDDKGELRTGFVSDVTGTVYLNCEGSATATVESVNLLPRRTQYTFTEAVSGKLSADNPGKIELDFMGFKATYDISFAGVPTFGADFTEPQIFDYSAQTTIWSDFAAENTRWAKFDGENLLVVSREGGTHPSILKWDEIKSGSPVSHDLDKTGISGGTFEVSAGDLSGGHIYVCNLSTGLSEAAPLKVYHWSDENATCETILEFAGSETVKGRWGDNMSVTLDEQGNGWFWFVDHASGASIVRFRVDNFTTVTPEPEVFAAPYSVAYYGTLNALEEDPETYVLTSTYQRAILLVKANNGALDVINRIEAKEGSDYPGVGETDARVINYNGERYLITSSCYGFPHKAPQALHVYDISAGMNTVMAFSEYNDGEHPQLWEYTYGGSNCSAFSANTGAAVGPDGNLRLMAASPKAGFVCIEVPKKR